MPEKIPSVTEDKHSSIAPTTEPSYLIIYMPENPDNFLVKITIPTGEIEFGKNYSPNEAAKIFWNAITTECFCNSCKFKKETI